MIKFIKKFNKGYSTLISFLEKYYIVFFIMLISLIGYICLKNLGLFRVEDYDEARHAVSAYEMMKNHDYIINTFNHQKDYWNLKPPLSFLAIIMFFKLFGVSIFSMRLYSSISMILVVVIVSIFTIKRYGRLESLIVLVLFSTQAPLYVIHAGRNGDADALFTLLFTLAMICMILIEKSRIYLYLCGFIFSLAFLTKSWHAFSIMIVGGLFLIFSGQISKLKLKQWIIFILSSVMPILIWIIARIYKDGPHFLIEMVNYDLIARSNTSLEGHVGNWTYYFDYLLDKNDWTLQILIGSVLISLIYFIYAIKNKRRDILGIVLWIVVPFSIFTHAKTKCFWYIIPVIIPIIMFIGVVMARVLKHKKLYNIIKLIIIIPILIGAIKLTNKNISMVSSPVYDNVQQFILDNIPKHKEITSTIAYTETEDELGSQWSQGRIFVAEISGDLFCKFGGIKDFENETQKSIIIVDDAIYNKNLNLLKQLEVVEHDTGYYILKR